MRLMCLLLTLLFSLCASGQDASMFRGNPEHTGIYEAAGVPEFTKIKWKFHTDGQVISSPTVVNDTAYVGSTDHNLYAIDLETGTQKWKFETKGRITSSPAVAGSKVYFGESALQ
jgi:eukaryotic-like serine/threonine-protein kinase